MRIKLSGILLVLVGAMSVASCSKKEDDTPSPSSPSETSTPLAKANSIALPTTPISIAAATGEIPATTNEIEKCPFLADEFALAMKAPKPLLRRKVSNEGCTWSANAGFVVDVTVEDSGKAKPFADRHYNMDKKTEVKSLKGPGEEPVLLSHTTWGRPIAYALGFKQDNKSIFIKATGVKADEKQLVAIANDVAKKLPTAPAIELQNRSEEAAFDHCSVLSEDSARSLFAVPEKTPVSTSGYSGGCAYKLLVESAAGITTLEISTAISPAGKVTPEKLLENSGSEKASGYPFPVVKKAETNEFATYSRLSAFVDGVLVSITASDSSKVAHFEKTKAVLDNVISRLSKP